MEENLTDALKMAFAVLIFVGALSICIITFSQARITSEAVLYTKDDTNYYEYVESTEQVRQVGMETIIPTLYRYYKENYKVQFFEEYYGKDHTNNNPLIIYESKKTREGINSFDVNEEISRREPWTGNVEKDYKLNLDAILSKKEFSYPDGSEQKMDYSANNLMLNKDTKFYEIFGEYQSRKMIQGGMNTIQNTTADADGENIELIKQEVKRVITYAITYEWKAAQ